MPSEKAPYAVNQETTKGRNFPEPPHRYRSDFERDRDRVIHCSAFRRLEGKTQVFTPGMDDNYRTRLTHTIEVAQIARTIASALKVNQNLTEAICLAHDLGHSPFGHCGEEILNGLMAGYGGFEHNRQALRIVELLEHPYPDFQGLNLMYETRLGLAKHHTPFDSAAVTSFAEKNCSLEGQIADLADRIAYNCHDLEDGLRARLIKPEQLKQTTVWVETFEKIHASRIDDSFIRNTRTVKTIMDTLITDCIETSRSTIAQSGIGNLEQIYNRPENLVLLSPPAQHNLAELEKFLLNNMYYHPTIRNIADNVRSRLCRLFEKFCAKPDLMPGYFRHFLNTQSLQRTVCDYIAGMTDRFCLKLLQEEKDEYKKIH
ncbi:MAG: deoxyguanosinetriphosphate triphosphohydrolase [Planctomycetota bacterium]